MPDLGPLKRAGGMLQYGLATAGASPFMLGGAISGLGHGLLRERGTFGEAFARGYDAFPLATHMTRGLARSREIAEGLGVHPEGLLAVELATPDAGDALGPLSNLAMIKMLHASPHRFTRFDFSRMGTGQGAAAKGKGGYFSHPDAPMVHRSYFDEFSESNAWEHPIRELRIRGDRPIIRGGEVPNYGPRPGESSVRGAFVEDVLLDERGLRQAYQQSGPEGVREVMLQHARELRDMYSDEWEEALPEVDRLIRTLERPGSVTADMPIASAQSYAVDIDVDPEDLLDYDAPLSQQSPAIQQILLRLRDTAQQGIDEGVLAVPGKQALLRDALDPLEWDATTGATVLNLLEDGEEVLREAGIPGLRYADYGSRGTEGGTYNVVMFPGTEDLIGEMQPGPLSPGYKGPLWVDE